MNCKRCGNLLNEGDMVCRNCGEPVNNINNGMPTPQQMGQPNMGQPASMPGMDSGMGGMPTPQQMPQQSYQPMGNPMDPMSMNQPMMNNQMNTMNSGYGAPQQPAPKSNKTFLIIVIALVAAIVAIGGVVVYKFVDQNKTETKDNKKDTDKKDTDNDTDNDKDTDNDNDKDKDDNDGGNVASENTFEVGGYVFTIPSDVKYVEEEGLLTISDSVNYQVNFTIDYYTYSELVKDPSEIIEEIEDIGFEISDKGEITVGGRKYYCIYITAGSNEGIFYFTNLDDDTVAMGLLQVRNDDGIETALKIINKIVDSVTKSSKFAPTDETKNKVDFNSLARWEQIQE